MIEVSDAITTLVAAIPPTVTLLAPVKLVPVIEIAVPAASNPEGGSTNVIVGAATYVNAPPTVSVPPGVVTETACEPAIPLGVTAVIEVDEITLRVVAATPPKVTRFAPVKLVPVIVISVPGPPLAGEKEVIAGRVTCLTVKLVALWLITSWPAPKARIRTGPLVALLGTATRSCVLEMKVGVTSPGPPNCTV